MDTLGAAAALVGLVVHLLSHPRVVAIFGAAIAERPLAARIAVAVLALAGLGLGWAGYHREWPRWANGRSAFGICIGALLLVVTILGWVVRESP